MENVRFRLPASQAKSIYLYKNIRSKLLKCAKIYFNSKLCLSEQYCLLQIGTPCSYYWHLNFCLDVEPWFYPGVEENGVKCLQPGGDSFLHVGVCRISLASKVLLKGRKELKITEREADKLQGWWSITTQPDRSNHSQELFVSVGPRE